MSGRVLSMDEHRAVEANVADLDQATADRVLDLAWSSPDRVRREGWTRPVDTAPAVDTSRVAS